MGIVRLAILVGQIPDALMNERGRRRCSANVIAGAQGDPVQHVDAFSVDPMHHGEHQGAAGELGADDEQLILDAQHPSLPRTHRR